VIGGVPADCGYDVDTSSSRGSQSACSNEIRKGLVGHPAEAILDQIVDGSKARHSLVVEEHVTKAWSLEVQVNHQDIPIATREIRSCDRKRS
jgi:hypothetical protein